MNKKPLILGGFSILLFASTWIGCIAFIKNHHTSLDTLGIHTSQQTVAVVLATQPLSATSSVLSPGIAEITHGDTSKKEVIFTFDGGGTIHSADKILEVLAKHHVKGTFFLTGKMIEAHPDLVKRIAAAGHEIFSHTYDHRNLTRLTDGQIMEELNKVESVLESTANISPKPYFRAPYGARDARVLAVAAKDGYQSVFWSVDALDWKGSRGETAQQVKDRILSNIAPGNIYLMHIGDNITGTILDEVFTTIESKGYKIVSLTQGI